MASRKREEVIVTSLGELYRGPNERKYWSSKRGRDRYPYPIGYRATRVQGGQEYQLEVAEGPNGPDFVVTDPGGTRYSSDTALRVWSAALRGNGRAGRIKENADGGEIFGFTQQMVKKYLQDLVAPTSDPSSGALGTSSTPLSPLACNTATASGGSRKKPAKASPKAAPAKRPASAGGGRQNPKKRKGDGPKLPSKVSLEERGVHTLAAEPLKVNCNEKAEIRTKRQKLGGLECASRSDQGPTNVQLQTQAVLEKEGSDPVLTGRCEESKTPALVTQSQGGKAEALNAAEHRQLQSQGREAEAPKPAEERHLQTVPAEGKALIAQTEVVPNSPEANKPVLARSQRARHAKLEQGKATQRSTQPDERETKVPSAQTKEAEGCGQAEGGETGQEAEAFGVEKEAQVEGLERSRLLPEEQSGGALLQGGAQSGGKSQEKGARSKFMDGAKDGAAEQGAADANQAACLFKEEPGFGGGSAKRRNTGCKGSPEIGSAERNTSNEATSAKGFSIHDGVAPDVLKVDHSADAATRGTLGDPSAAVLKRPSRPANSPPSGVQSPGVRARSTGSFQSGCPNHTGEYEHVPRTVDMEAETEPDSDASQSADLEGEGLGSGGGAEVESALADKVEAAADVRDGIVSGGGGKARVRRSSLKSIPAGSGNNAEAAEQDAGLEPQGGSADDSTEAPDSFPSPPAVRQGGRPPTSLPGEEEPRGKAGPVDFEADQSGWFTAARGRTGSLAGLIKDAGGTDGNVKSGAVVRTADKVVAKGTARGKSTLGPNDRVVPETEDQGGGFGVGFESGGRTGDRRNRSRRKAELRANGNGAELDKIDGQGSRAQGTTERSAGEGGPRTVIGEEGTAGSDQGTQASKGLQETNVVVKQVEGLTPAAAVLRSGSPVGVAETEGGKRKLKRLSLTPFKRFRAAEDGKAAAEKLKDCVVGRGFGAGVSEVRSMVGAQVGKRKLGDLTKVAGLDWDEPLITMDVSCKETTEQDEGAAKQLAPQAGGLSALRTNAKGMGSADVSPNRIRLSGSQEKQATQKKTAPDTATGSGRPQSADVSSRQSEEITGASDKKPAVRLVGSDSLTEQQSEPRCVELDAGEGKETSEAEAQEKPSSAAAETVQAESATAEEEELGSRDRGKRPMVDQEGAERLDGGWRVGKGSAVKVDGPKASETESTGTVRKGGLTPLSVRPSGGPSRPLSGRLIEPVVKGRPASPITRPERSPKANPQSGSSPTRSGDSTRSPSWLGKAVDKMTSAFRAAPGYMPLALTRSRDAVSNSAITAQAPKDDTVEGAGKSRPRNKSWPTWTGPTSNPNLGRVWGSARKATLPKEVPRASEATLQVADVTGVTSARGANQGQVWSRALESQARRLGRFEESEAVRDWPVGECLVPSTPPDTAGEETPRKEGTAVLEPPEARSVFTGEPKLEGPVTKEGAANGRTGLGRLERGLVPGALLPVCCLEQPKGPVLWSVLHEAGREVRLGVCVEGDKAQRSVFVYNLFKGLEQRDWEVNVLGAIAGTVRMSNDPEQAASPGPFLQFSPEGDVLVVTDSFSIQELASVEPASKRPCLRLVSLVQQRPKLLARLDCASSSSCLLVTGPRTLAAGEAQGTVECWAMKPDWRSLDEKWTLPVARYRGVTFPAIVQLQKVPGRPRQLLGCSENGSFAVWDVHARTLLSTCHSMHYLVASAHVLSGPVLLPKASIHTPSAETPIYTAADLRPEAQEADGENKPLYLLLRATARGELDRGASCWAALLRGDELVVGKQLLVAERAVHVACLGSTGVASDCEGRVLLWDALTGQTVALSEDLKGTKVTSVATQEEAGLLAVGAQDGRLMLYSRQRVPWNKDRYMADCESMPKAAVQSYSTERRAHTIE